jgi:uncharacterized protein YegL
MNTRSKFRFPIIPASYTAVFLLVLLAALNLTLPLGPGVVDLMLLLDESGSIKAGWNDATWQSFIRQSRSLPAGSRVSLIRFADRPRLELPWVSIEKAAFAQLTASDHPPRRLSLDPGATSIGSALRLAVRYTSADRNTVLLLSSDGIDNVEPRDIGFPLHDQGAMLSLFYMKSPSRWQDAPFYIESINLATKRQIGQTLPLSIAFESINGGQGGFVLASGNRILGKQSLSLKPGERRLLHFRLPDDNAGRQMLEFIVHDKNGLEIDHRRRVVDAMDGRRLLFIDSNAADTKVPYLYLTDWQVVHVQANRLSVDESYFKGFDMVILNDLGRDAIDPQAMSNLIRSVERFGTGLIVLGGPHSFGSGGYRRSALENLLPVVAEASRPKHGAAFLFLVDKSGSMEASNSHGSRLADALRAVSESAKSLRSGDESGLMVFDRDIQTLLPLARRADAMSALERPWQLQPSGGTQLVPALQKAIETLAASDSRQRFLVLVTDGFINGAGIEPVLQAIQAADIRPISLTIGQDADLSTLRRLAEANNGRVLSIGDSAQLPRFMRQALEKTQNSWHDTAVTPRTLLQLPSIIEKETHWRRLDGYQVTRGKASAKIYVATDTGDPLLAIRQAGAGRVAALPGGLLETSTDDNLLGGLVNWMNGRRINPNLQVSHSYRSGLLEFVVDAVDSEQRWLPAMSAELTLTLPGGESRFQPMTVIAPGRFATTAQATAVGVYTARITIGAEHTAYTAYVGKEMETHYGQVVPWLQNARAKGDVLDWTPTDLDDLLSSTTGRHPTRSHWLILALTGYLSLIAFERAAGLRYLWGLLSRRSS